MNAQKQIYFTTDHEILSGLVAIYCCFCCVLGVFLLFAVVKPRGGEE